MALPTPNLDDRKFQDIVREARSKIPQYCPKWTDYNLSDPGITLIELFAWMVDKLLYRLNRVPEKNYIKFMELIGIHLEPPNPATESHPPPASGQKSGRSFCQKFETYHLPIPVKNSGDSSPQSVKFPGDGDGSTCQIVGRC